MIIGICGQAGAGKDTVADFLVKNHDFAKVALADPLKRICKEVFDFTDEQLWGPSEKRNEPDLRYRRIEPGEELVAVTDKDVLGIDWGPTFLTPRYALQQLGTEWGRRCHPDVWVDYALRVAKAVLIEQRSYSAQEGLGWGATGYQARRREGVVISDVRFKNEVDAIRAAGGIVWRIIRHGAGLPGAAGTHRSETEQNEIPDEAFSATIHNGSDLVMLERTTGTLLKTFRMGEKK